MTTPTDQTMDKPNWRKRTRWLRQPLRRAFKPLVRRVEYGLFRLFIGLFALLGLARGRAFGAWLGRTLGSRLGVSKRALRNLARSFPEKSEAERKAVLLGVWDNLGRTSAEYAHLSKMTIYTDDPMIRVHGQDVLERIKSGGTGGIFFSGHFANWEVMPLCLTGFGLDTVEIYRAANNPHTDAWLVRNRTRHIKAEQVSKDHKGGRAILSAAKSKRHLAMLIDQKLMEGIPVQFFGRPAMTPPAAARMAIKYAVPLVPVSIVRAEDGRFDLTVHEPVAPIISGNLQQDVFDTTQMMTGIIEDLVRRTPEQWLWLHNRWGGAGRKAVEQIEAD